MASQKGGIDCKFVEKPPKGIQSDCPVCLLVLRDPYQATCCGYGFCRVCIERVKADNKPCPCCKREGFDCFEDKGRSRSLNEYDVYCTNERQGCRWVGGLGKLEDHLNSKPSQDKQLEGCPFTNVPCLHCSEPFQRSILEIHQNNECPKRPFSCKYCKDYDSNYEDVIHKHWPLCGGYPVQCPKKCSDETMERRNLRSHIDNDCPLKIVHCKFRNIGCEVRLPLKRLSTHLSEGVVAHMLLQTKQLMELKEENNQLKQQVENLNKDLWLIKTGSPLCPVELTMTNFEQHRKDCDSWFSPPFYTCPNGYKLCLSVFAGGNGDGLNTHVSLYLYLMKGEYDEQLNWPFQGKFTIHLLSQNAEDKKDHMSTATFDDGAFCSRVVDGERAEIGRGDHMFLPHSEMKPKYLQNDCIKFCVRQVD